MENCEIPQEGSLPLYLSGKVVSGFGRGSTELGFPTGRSCVNSYLPKANVDPEDFSVPVTQQALPCGVYYGFSKLGNEEVAQRMVMSLGTNPHYKNQEKTLVGRSQATS